jgi:DUF4097 and DUF4098 domain-containing protein YvlB
LRRLIKYAAPCFILLLALLIGGCTSGPGDSGSFDRTLTVTGPVQLELHNGSGHVEIRAGQAGQVRIHADFTVWSVFFEDDHGQVQDLNAHPPVDQQGNVVRVGYQDDLLRHVRVDYTIYVPAETEVRAQIGSGNLDVSDVQGPAVLRTGSGGIIARHIHNDTDADSGSGGIALTDISGRATANTGSGTIEISRASGDVKATTGSGKIDLEETRGRLNVRTGSGSIQITGAADDLRASTGSGSIHVEGNPSASSYWQIHTSSGSVTLEVPSDASFRVHATSHSSGISSDLPLVVEQHSRREMRGRIGNGTASVEMETGSGSIHIR